MPKPNKHRIDSLQDIIEKVPPEKLDHFLDDLRAWVRMHHDIKRLPLPAGITHAELDPGFVWIDDGAHNVAVHVTVDIVP